MKPSSQGKVIHAADLFCGAGGTSSGMVAAVEALGYDLDLLAVNHWSIAIDTHSTNHATSRHLCQTLDTIDPLKAIPGGRLNLLVASPECIHHSNARGGKPMSDQSRASAWMILNWLEKLYVENVLIENVPEFRGWGPLGANGRPLKSKKGELYQLFLKSLRALGYTVQDNILNAADFGDATTRRRLFVMATRNRKVISWPEPSHMSREKLAAAEKQPALFERPKLSPWRPAREIIDWGIEGRSIFGRKKPLSVNTMRRIYAGLKKFSGLEFIVPQFGQQGPRDVNEPLGTLTTTSRGVGVVKPFIVGAGGPTGQGAPRSVEDPMRTVLTDDHQGLIEPFILPHQHGSSGENVRDVEQPMPTVTGTSSDIFLAQPYVVVLRNHADGRSLDEPVPALCANGQHLGLIEPFLTQCEYGSGDRLYSKDGPIPTVTGRTALGVVEPFTLTVERPLTNRSVPRSTEEPIATITGTPRVGMAEPFISRFNGSHAGRNDGANRNYSVDEPMRTQDTSNRFGLVDPFVIQHFGERAGQAARARSADDPLWTITGQERLALIEPYLLKSYTGSDAASLDYPAPAITANFEHLGLCQPFVVRFNMGMEAMSVDDPLGTITTRDKFGVVELEMQVLGRLEILFRMLQPHELAAAMSFPKSYHFVGTREQKVKQIGNAVPCRLAQALCTSLLSTEKPKVKVAA